MLTAPACGRCLYKSSDVPVQIFLSACESMLCSFRLVLRVDTVAKACVALAGAVPWHGCPGQPGRAEQYKL